MITMKEWMELVGYRITEGSAYTWQCYGSDAYTLDSWNGEHDGHSFSVIFDTKTQTVYEVQAHDYVHNRAYRMINEDFRKKNKKEAKRRSVNRDEAWDDVEYVDLEVDDDFIQKCLAISAGEDYDTRIKVPVDFSDEELLQYMKLAHERDMTFNELVEEALRHAISEYEAGRLTKEDAQRFILERETAWPFEKEEDEDILPEMNKGPINIEALLDEQHFTQPPPRYSEASLVKKLEELGIGRPSTYASIISVISTRGYAETINKRFHPTDRGKLISAFLEKLFSKYVDYNFTAGLENQLDDITTGKEGWIRVLEMFWKDFNQNVSDVKEKRTREVLDLLNDSLGSLIFERDKEGNINRQCKLCDTGSLSLKNSFRGGAFIGCSNYPECKFTRPLSKAKAAAQSQLAEPKFIGKHENGNDMYLKNGRFGPYLQYEKILEEIKEVINPKRHTVISVVTGRKIADIEAVLGTEVAIVRSMPNTAISVGQSMTCLSANSRGIKNIELAKTIFNSLGQTIQKLEISNTNKIELDISR